MTCPLRRRGSSLINRKHNNALSQSINLILKFLQTGRHHANGKNRDASLRTETLESRSYVMVLGTSIRHSIFHVINRGVCILPNCVVTAYVVMTVNEPISPAAFSMVDAIEYKAVTAQAYLPSASTDSAWLRPFTSMLLCSLSVYGPRRTSVHLIINSFQEVGS